MGKVIGIMSLKGGVGKTSVVASLGSALAELGKNVLLIDANFHAPNLGIHFNLIDPEVTLHDVLSRKANVRDAIYAVGNLDILPSSIFASIILVFVLIVTPAFLMFSMSAARIFLGNRNSGIYKASAPPGTS